MALLRGATQVLDNSINISKIVADFLEGNDWDITNGNNNATITGLANGVNPHDAVNYQQLMDLINGRQWKDSVRAFADTNVTLSGNQTIDGVTLADGDRVACLNQTTTTEDGVYIVDTGGAWTRATDWASGDGAANYSFYVEEGTNYADTQWTISNDSSADTIGTHDLIPSQTGGAGTIVAGAGLLLTGNTIDVQAADNSIKVNADDIQVQIGNTNGNSLEVTATGLELLSTVTGDRTFSNTNFTVSSSGNINLNSNNEVGYINIGNTSTNGTIIKSGNNIDLLDKQVNSASTTTAIPFAIKTTIDHGSGTNDGAIIDDFRNAFTDEAVINALVELHDAVASASSTLNEAYEAGAGTTSSPTDHLVTMDSGSVEWRLTPNSNFSPAVFSTTDHSGNYGLFIKENAVTDVYLSFELKSETQEGTGQGILLQDNVIAGTGGGITLETLAGGGTSGSIKVSSENALTLKSVENLNILATGGTGANINIEADKGIAITANGENLEFSSPAGKNTIFYVEGNKVRWLGANGEYEVEQDGLRLANYATASLPTVQTGSFGALVFDTDEDRPKIWISDIDGSGTDGWLKVLLEGDASVYTFENGLTENSGTVKLGGLLTADTSIGVQGFGFTFTNSGTANGNFYVNMNNGGGGSSITVDENTLVIEGHHPGVQSKLELSNSGAMIFTSGTGVGVEYAADYSANYSLRSLVDKEYVDKKSDTTRIVRVFSDSNVDISSAPSTIDGVTMANGDLVALLNQTTTTEDGIYVYDASGSAMTRLSDFDTGKSVGGYTIVVEEGTNNADKVYLITNNKGADVVGTDDLTYTLINGASLIDLNVAYENGAGSTASPTDQTIEIDSGNILWNLKGNANFTSPTFQISNSAGASIMSVKVNSNNDDSSFVVHTVNDHTGNGGGISFMDDSSDAGDGNGITFTARDLTGGNGTGGDILFRTQTFGGTAGIIKLWSDNTIDFDSSNHTINFADNEVHQASTTTVIPFAITTTIDHGSGTTAGAIINDFRNAFTDEAIINALVELHDGIVSNSLTAGNGLQINNGEIQLGNDGSASQASIANLTRNTILDDNGNDVQFRIKTNGGGVYNKLYMNPGTSSYTLLGIEDSSNYTGADILFNKDRALLRAGGEYQSFFKINTDQGTEHHRMYVGTEIDITSGDYHGLEYDQDYSNYYLDRTLVDKAYVDNKVANTEIIDEPGTIIDANAGTVRITGHTGITKVKVYLNGNRLSPPEISSIADGTGSEAGNTIITINSATQVLTAGDAVYVDFME